MYTIYHNPRCSKSRQTLALLQEHTDDIRIVEYLKDAPAATELAALFARFEGEPADLVRNKDARKDGVTVPTGTDVPAWLASNIRYLERPLVDDGSVARLGRPPENILAFFTA